MSRYRFELATPADDADLRRVLAATPMPGPVPLTFGREPSYFAAAVVEGRFRQVVAARECVTNQVVGFGARAISERFVNGRCEPIGYLSNLRLLAEHRNRGLVALGFECLRRLHADGKARLYLTTIAEGNDTALRLLTSGRAGLPAYHYAGRYHTAALALGQATVSARTDSQVRPARVEDLPAILEFLNAVGPRRQFFPCYQAADFFSVQGTLRDLEPADLLLAFRAGRLVGTLGGWDQHGFRQTMVAGTVLRYRTAVLPVVADDDADVFAALLDAWLARDAEGPAHHLLIGLHDADPLLPVVQQYRPQWYTTRLYLVCYPDGEELRAGLDGRPPYLELGCL